MASRAYAQKEWRLLGWWLATFHQNADIYMNVRLGPQLPQKETGIVAELPATVSRVFQRYIDAIYVEHGLPFLVEAKLDPDPGIFSQLLHYARMFRLDPNWTSFANRPLGLIALVYQDDPEVSAEAAAYGVQWTVYQPKLEDLPAAATRMTAAGGASEPPPLPSDWPSRMSSWGVKALS
jgi:hypothetical protein